MGKQEVGNRRGGCSGAVKNPNATHNYLAFTFLLSFSSQTQATPERLHRVAKGLATISVPSQYGKAHWIGWLLLHLKKISHVLSSLYHLSTTTQRCHLQQHPVVTLSSPPIILQLHQVRILSQRQNKRYEVLDTCNDQ